VTKITPPRGQLTLDWYGALPGVPRQASLKEFTKQQTSKTPEGED